jgi:RNA polymerase sigma-70 factor (ECF subfamily)
LSRQPTHLRPVATAGAEADGKASVDAAIAAAMDGDVEAWGALYEALYLPLFRQLRYLCGDRHTAEELTQDTFAQAMVHRARYDRRRPFLAWLRGIALNIAHNRWRKEQGGVRARRKLELIVNAQARPDDPADRQLDVARSRALYAALDELPEQWREAFILKELQDLTAAEVGTIVGATENNVAVRVTRARQRIREILTREGWLDAQEDVR